MTEPQYDDVATPGQLLALIAEVGRAGSRSAALVRRLEGQRALDERVGEFLDEALATVPTDLPPEVDLQPGWLEAIEAVDLAHQGFSWLPSGIPWLADVGRVIEGHRCRLEGGARRAALRGELLRHGRRAEEAGTRGAGHLLPWTVVPAALAPDAEVRVDEIVAAWGNGELAAVAEAALTGWVNARALPWHASYRAQVRREATRPLHVTRWRADVSLDAATNLQDLAGAELLRVVGLPHLGRDARVEVRRHVHGTAWCVIASGASHAALAPWEQREHRWGDQVIGALATPIEVSEPSELEQAAFAVDALARAVASPVHPRSLGVALALAAELASGSLGTRVAEAARAFDRGDAVGEHERWALLGLTARVELDRGAARFDSPALHEALADADEALAECGGAVLLLDDEAYALAVGDDTVDADAWWGARALLPSLGEVERALASLRGPARALEMPGRFAYAGAATSALPLAAAEDDEALARIRRLASCPAGARNDAVLDAIVALRALPCVWLRHDVGQAVADLERALGSGADGALVEVLRRAIQPTPGRVPILLHREGRGFVTELRVRHAPGLAAGAVDTARGPGSIRWGKPDWLLPLARDAIRSAFAAAARHTASGLPPHDFTEYAVELVGTRSDAVEGRSLALPAALAFASSWLDRPLPADLAATGSIDAATGAVAPVGEVWLKSEALARWARGRPMRLMLARENLADASNDGVHATAVTTLAEALAAAGVSLSSVALEPALGDQAERQTRLAAMCVDVEAQRLERYALAGIDPWLVVADRMRLFIRSLEEAPGARALLERARLWSALAFDHGGDAEAAAQMLAGVATSAATPLPVRALHRIVRVGQLIDEAEALAPGAPARDEACARCAEEATLLATAIDELAANDVEALRGRALGALARVALHQRRHEQALGLFAEAVREHQRSLPREVGRSRVQLASALRLAGHADEALAELERASAELDGPTRAFSVDYASTCRMFWGYERARALIDLGHGEEAIVAGSAARELARGRGWWPELGIVRTLAWALRLVGRDGEAEASAADAAAIAKGAPPPMRDLAARIAAEAAGPPRSDGEVY